MYFLLFVVFYYRHHTSRVVGKFLCIIESITLFLNLWETQWGGLTNDLKLHPFFWLCMIWNCSTLPRILLNFANLFHITSEYSVGPHKFILWLQIQKRWDEHRKRWGARESLLCLVSCPALQGIRGSLTSEWSRTWRLISGNEILRLSLHMLPSELTCSCLRASWDDGSNTLADDGSSFQVS